MASIADFERLLARCEVIRQEHEKMRDEIQSLSDSDCRRVLLQKFEESSAITNQSLKLAREALNRERAKLN